MRIPRDPVRRLLGLEARRPRLSDAVDWEIEHHLTEIVDRLVEEGWNPEEAREEAIRRFGDTARHRRRILSIDRKGVAVRRQRVLWEALRTGWIHAIRGVRRSPGFSSAVVATLALGIGVNATMFGILDRILLRPPAHVVAHEQVRRIFLERHFRPINRTSRSGTLTYPDFLDFRTIPDFEAVGAFTWPQDLTVGHGPEASRARTVLASHDFFAVLGVRPGMGRFYGAEDDLVGAAPTAVLGWEYWQREYGGEADVLGTTLELSGHRLTIIGIAPPGFTGVDLERVDVWVPIEMTRGLFTGSAGFRSMRGNWWLKTVARVAETGSLASGEEQATALVRNSRQSQIDRGYFDPEARIFTGPLIAARGPMASAESKVSCWLAGVSIIVFLIACANVANLFLARLANRRREIALRLSLGVSQVRLVGEAMLEAVLLALMAGAVAIALATWGSQLIRATLIPDVLWTSSGVEGRVLWFTVGASIAAGLLAGVGPALQSTRADLTVDLRDGTPGATLRRSPLRSSLAVFQAALSVVLLMGAGLFVKSLAQVRGLDLGLDVERVGMANLELMDDPDTGERRRLYDEAVERVLRIPGVTHATVVNVPFHSAYAYGIRVPGVDSIPSLPGGGPYFYIVSPSYMETLDIRIVRGRDLRDADTETSRPVALVNETMARTLWPESEAVGACFYFEGEEECRTVVGVVEDASRGGLRGEPYMAGFLPLAQWSEAPAALYFRAERDPEELVAPVAQALRTFSPRVRFANVRTLRETLDPQTRAWRLGATLFTTFGALALAVAAIGLYSLLAFDLARQNREYGIRAALGAGRSRLLRGILSGGTRLGVLGIVVGLVVSMVVAPFMEGLLFDVGPRDPAVIMAVTLTLLCVAVGACLPAAIRATLVDPLVALRNE